MKLTNLLKKIATAALTLAVIGMLAACSKDSGDSATYKVMYDDILILDGGTAEDMEKTKQIFSASYYTMNGNTMVLNDDGLDFALEMWTDDDTDPCVAILVYQKKMQMPLSQKMMNSVKNAFELNTDYTLTHNNKVVELTDAGYAKVSSGMSM